MIELGNSFLLENSSRRRFLAGAAALTAGSFVSWRAFALSAASQRFVQGDFEVAVVSDGELTLPLEVYTVDATPEEAAEIAKRLGWVPPTAQGHTNHALIKSATDLILVDTGSGPNFQPTAGKLVGNLKAMNIDPGAVTKVILTHGHPDHVWGNTDESGALQFPNAAYYVGAAEWDFWMAPDLMTRMPAEMADFVKGAQRAFGAVKDKVTMIKPGDDIVAGIRAMDTAGHTPGHLSLEVAGGDGLIITADACTNELISLEHPNWKFGFDADPELAIKNRKALVDRAATDKTKLLGYHWVSPMGYAEKSGTAYKFVPAA